MEHSIHRRYSVDSVARRFAGRGHGAAIAGLFYIAPDHLGAPHQITDAGGAVAWQWNPDPFGNGDPVGAFAYDLRGDGDDLH